MVVIVVRVVMVVIVVISACPIISIFIARYFLNGHLV